MGGGMRLVGKCLLAAAGKSIIVLPEVETESEEHARRVIRKTLAGLRYAGVRVDGELTWLPAKDVARWWKAGGCQVVIVRPAEAP